MTDRLNSRLLSFKNKTLSAFSFNVVVIFSIIIIKDGNNKLHQGVDVSHYFLFAILNTLINKSHRPLLVFSRKSLSEIQYC